MSKPGKKKPPRQMVDRHLPEDDPPDLGSVVSATECTGAVPALPPDHLAPEQGDGE